MRPSRLRMDDVTQTTTASEIIHVVAAAQLHSDVFSYLITAETKVITSEQNML